MKRLSVEKVLINWLELFFFPLVSDSENLKISLTLHGNIIQHHYYSDLPVNLDYYDWKSEGNVTKDEDTDDNDLYSLIISNL